MAVDAGDARAQSGGTQSREATAEGLLRQDTLTGDWKGLRTRWKDHGVDLRNSLTQFYQGVSSGGTETSSEYNGTAQAKIEFDFGNLAGWEVLVPMPSETSKSE